MKKTGVFGVSVFLLSNIAHAGLSKSVCTILLSAALNMFPMQAHQTFAKDQDDTQNKQLVLNLDRGTQLLGSTFEIGDGQNPEPGLEAPEKEQTPIQLKLLVELGEEFTIVRLIPYHRGALSDPNFYKHIEAMFAARAVELFRMAQKGISAIKSDSVLNGDLDPLLRRIDEILSQAEQLVKPKRILVLPSRELKLNHVTMYRYEGNAELTQHLEHLREHLNKLLQI